MDLTTLLFYQQPRRKFVVFAKFMNVLGPFYLSIANDLYNFVINLGEMSSDFISQLSGGPSSQVLSIHLYNFVSRFGEILGYLFFYKISTH